MSPTTSSTARRAAQLLGALLLAAIAALQLSPSHAGADRAATGRFHCHGLHGRPWAQVAARPNSWVTGNCAEGTSIHRTYHSDAPAADGGWDGGEVFGSYAGCGVVKSDEDVVDDAGAAYQYCGSVSDQVEQNPAAFISQVDCNTEEQRAGRCTGADGKPFDPDLHGANDTTVRQNCQAYANARPFSATPALIDPVQIIPAGTGRFRWRYTTQRGGFVLGFDSGAPATGAEWVFLPVSCVNLPHARAFDGT